MRFATDLSQRAEQRLALAPRMLQSIEILQLATADLAAWLEQEVERNVTLEAEPRPGADEPVAAVAERVEHDRAERPEADLAPRRPLAASATAETFDWLATVPTRGPSLDDHVRHELALRDVSSELADAVLGLAGLLDERGLLTATDDEVRCVVDEDVLPTALDLLRSIEPGGLGARSGVEAMLWQVSQTDPDRPALCALLDDHLELLARNRWREVGKSLGIGVDEVAMLVDRLRRLDPAPGAGFVAEDATAAVLHPDVVVRVESGQIVVYEADGRLPVLRVNDDYATMLEHGEVAGDVRRYLRGQLRHAREVIAAVEQRRHTLHRVTAAIMARQRPFLERGPAAMQPLRMRDVADVVELHTSTVSRAIAGKNVATDHGIHPLRVFFDGARGSGPADGRAASGTPVAGAGRVAVREQIRGLIRDEDGARPLSDDEIVRRLATRGVEVARRTVAKYRDELGIPSSWRRRRHGES